MPAKIKFNWKLAAVLAIGFVVLGITAFTLRQWRRTQRADRALVLGKKAYQQKNWEKAAENLGSYIALHGDDMEMLLKYAEAQLNIRPLKPGNVNQAISTYRTVLRTEKTNLQAVLKLAGIYLELNMAGEAELIIDRFLSETQKISDSRKIPEVHRLLASALIKQRRFDEAINLLKNTITDYPNYIPAYESLAALAQQRPEDFNQPASFWYDRAVKNNPDSADAYTIRAAYHLRKQNSADALADLELAEQKDLSDPNTRIRLAEQLINANELQKAQAHLETVQAVEKSKLELWKTWARLAIMSGSKEKMNHIAQTAIQQLSNNWDFVPITAELFILADQPDKAQNCIQKLRQKNIAPATTAALEALAAYQKADYYEAVKAWRRARQLGKDSIQLRLRIADALSKVGDSQSAIRQLRSTVLEKPNHTNAHLALARLLLEAEYYAEAAEHARTACELEPTNLNAVLLYTHSQIQLLAAQQTKPNAPAWNKIEHTLEQLEKATPNPLPVQLLQLQLLTQRNDFEKAQKLLDDIKQDNQPEPQVALAQARLLIEQGKNENAIEILTSAADSFPAAIRLTHLLAILLAENGKLQDCENLLKSALTNNNQSQAKSRLGLLLARLYLHWDRPQERYQFLNTLAKQLPEDILIKRELLNCSQIKDRPQQAQKIIDEIKTIEGQQGWQWRLEQAKLWTTSENFNDKFTQITSLLKENLTANPDDNNSRTLLAAVYEKAGQLQLAVSTYRQALSRSPRDINLITRTISALYRANEYSQADQILQQTAREKLFHPQLKKLELQSYLRKGQFKPAERALEDLLNDDPNNMAVCLALAIIKIKQNNFAEADSLLSELRDQKPDFLPVISAQVESNIQQGKTAQAISLCDELITKSNSSSAYIVRAKTYASLGQNQKASEDFQHAIDIEPNNVTAWLARSDFLRSANQLEKATADIKMAMSIEPSNLLIQKRAIPLLLTSKRPENIHKGKELLDKALTENPKDPELQINKARTLLADQTAPALEQATAILQKLTSDYPHIREPWILLAQIAIRKQQPAQALDTIFKGLVYRPNDRSLLLLKASAEAASSPALAIPTLKALTELDPNDTDIVLKLADTYMDAEKPALAVNLLEEYLNKHPAGQSKKQINIALAIALYKNQNKIRAHKILDSMQQAEPNNPQPLLAYIRLLTDGNQWEKLKEKLDNWCQKHPEDIQTPLNIANTLTARPGTPAKQTAEKILRSILQNHPDSTEALCNLAILLQTAGHSSESADLYRKAISFEPYNAIAINNLAWILCEKEHKYQQALELAQRALKNPPPYLDINYINLIDTRGMIYFRLGEFQKAVNDFTKCIELYPPANKAVVSSHLHLAKALAKQGRGKKAVEILEKTLKLNNQVGGGLTKEDLDYAQRLIQDLSQEMVR